MTARDFDLGLVPDGSGLVKLAAAAVGGALDLWDAARARGMMLATHQPRPLLKRQRVCGLQPATFLEGPVEGLGPLEFDLQRRSGRKRRRLRLCAQLRRCRRCGCRRRSLVT